MSPEAPMWVPPATLPATSPATTSPWWGQQQNTTSKLRPAANTYESNGTVFFVSDGCRHPTPRAHTHGRRRCHLHHSPWPYVPHHRPTNPQVQKDGPGGAKSKISEREAVTPSGQRIFILPRAVNAEVGEEGGGGSTWPHVPTTSPQPPPRPQSDLTLICDPPPDP